MKKVPLAIVTTSLVRSKEEEVLVDKTIKKLSQLNIPLIITDGGSKNDFIRKISSYPKIILFYKKNLTSQLRKSFSEGAKAAEALFYLHTDKLDFAQKYVQPMIRDYLKQPKNSMLIPSRTAKSHETYPLYQKQSELFLNFMISDYLGEKEDYYYGPKILSSQLVPYFKYFQGEIGWGFESFMYVVNKRLNFPMKFYKVDVQAPKDVGIKEDVINYRLRNIIWQIEGLVQGKKMNL